MNHRTLLRLLVVVHLVLMVLGVGLSFFDDHLLPRELAEWKSMNALGQDMTVPESALFSLLSFAIFAAWCVWMLLYLVASIGLLCLKRWAAYGMMALTALSFGFVLIEPTVESSLLSVLSQLHLIVSGAVLAVAFVSDALQERTHGA